VLVPSLAERFNGKAVKLDNFVDYAKDADILITSTGAPHYIITEREAKKITSLRKGEPIVMIDIAVPRDIDPGVADMEGIYLFNIDSQKIRHSAKRKLVVQSLSFTMLLKSY